MFLYCPVIQLNPSPHKTIKKFANTIITLELPSSTKSNQKENPKNKENKSNNTNQNLSSLNLKIFFNYSRFIFEFNYSTHPVTQVVLNW